jgi:hypothetical protein
MYTDTKTEAMEERKNDNLSLFAGGMDFIKV